MDPRDPRFLEAIKRGYDDEPADGVARARLPRFVDRRGGRATRRRGFLRPPPPSPRSSPSTRRRLSRRGPPELAGEVVPGGWGADPSNRVDAPGRCCMCRANPPLRRWVHRGDAACGDRRGQCRLNASLNSAGRRPHAGYGADVSPDHGYPGGRGRARGREREGDGTGRGRNGDISGDSDVPRAPGHSGDRMFRRSTRPRQRSPRALASAATPRWTGTRVDPKCLRRANEPRVRRLPRARRARRYEPHASYDGPRFAGASVTARNRRGRAPRCRDHAGASQGTLTTSVTRRNPNIRRRCFEPDAHTHGAGDRWLKFTETPESPQVNQRGANDDRRMDARGTTYRSRHGAPRRRTGPAG